MTTAQKLIKYLATAFAIFLIITIISGILSALYALSGVLGLKKHNKEIKSEMKGVSIGNDNITTLDIDVAFTNLVIKKGEKLAAETNNSNIICKQNNRSLKIKEESHNWFANNNEGDLIIYIPENIQFEKVKINAGAGKIEIQDINTRNIDLELGAGATEIKELNVTNDCKIESGAGRVKILSGEIHNLDLDMGVGEFDVTSLITGNSKIEAGIGNLKLNLQGDKESYKIKANKGIGSIKINGKEVSDNVEYGDGDNIIKIDGGIGAINIHN